MTGSSSKLLQTQGKWHWERKPNKNSKNLRQKKSKNYSTPFMCSWDGETVKQGRQPTAGHETGGGNDGRMLW
jgi:hypothetical protein